MSWTPNTAFWAGSSIFEAARATNAHGAGITGGDHCHLEKYHISWSMLCPGPAPNRRVGSNCYRGSRHHRGSNGAAAATAASPANNRTCRHACYQAAWTAAPLHAATKVLHVCSFTCKNECSLHSVLAKKEQPQHTTESLVPISGTDNWALSGCRTRSHSMTLAVHCTQPIDMCTTCAGSNQPVHLRRIAPCTTLCMRPVLYTWATHHMCPRPVAVLLYLHSFSPARRMQP